MLTARVIKGDITEKATNTDTKQLVTHRDTGESEFLQWKNRYAIRLVIYKLMNDRTVNNVVIVSYKNTN